MTTRLWLTTGEAIILMANYQANDKSLRPAEWFEEIYGAPLSTCQPNGKWYLEFQSDDAAIEFKLRYM